MTPTGMTSSGNIDLTRRPRVKNADGTISTVRSLGVNVDGQEVLIPTVSEDGRIMGDQEAISQYRKTGMHLGKFSSPEASTAYAQTLHEDQAKMYANPAPSGPGDALFDQMLQTRDKAGALRSSVSFGVTQNPDAYAKASQLAARAGTRPQAVLENGTAFEQAGRLQAFDFDAFTRNTPRLASWASTPDNAAQAHDDLPLLQHLEEIGSQIAQVPMRAMGSLFEAMGGGARLVGSLAEQAQKPGSSLMSKIVGYGLMPSALIAPGMATEVRQGGEDIQNYYRPIFTNPALQAETRSGKVTQFAGGIAGAMGKAILSGPAAPLVFGAEAFGAKSGQALDTGATPNQALLEGSGSGALNTLLGVLPGGAQNQSLARAALTRVGRGVVLGAGVTVGENLLTRIHDSKIPLTQGMAENIVNFLGMEAAGAYHERVNRMAQVAAESKLRERAPEAFKEVVAQITKDSPVEHVLVPAEAFQTYFQSQGLDPAKVADAAGARNYVEALAAGTDVVIPMADYLTSLAKDHHQGLAPDLRLNAGELTPRELETFKQEAVKVEAEVKDQGAAAVVDAKDPAFQAIKEDTLRQLVAAGDDPGVAETRATIHAKAMVTLAERAGMDPITLQEAYGLRITRPLPGESGSLVDRALGRLAEGQAPVDSTFFQTAPKDMSFGSKAWQEYYGLTRGAGRAAGDLALRARAAMEKALTSKGQNAELDRRAAEALAQEHAFQAFDAEARKIVAGEVFASGEDKQAFIQFGADRKMQIGVLEKANLSYFTHETGHMYVEVLHDLAAREGSSQQVKDDLAALRKFAGAEGDAPLTTPQHEKLARANEAYLMEGKAPSEALQGAFQRVKFWMLNVYRNITGLGVKLNDDVRGVFDRIYASDVEIEQARQEVGGDRQLFAKPEDMGVTPAEFDLYVKAKGKEIAKAKEVLASRLIRELERERTTWWKDESEKVRQDVAAEVDGDAVYQAFKALADGKLEDGTPIKLSKEALVAQFGEGVVKELPRKFQRLYAREGGMDAEAAAEHLGFRSGEALVESLKAMEPRKDRIERLTQERMKEAHGDLTAPQAIADAALEAMHSDERGQNLAAELKALRAQQRKMKPAQDLRDAKAQGKEAVKAAKAEGAAALQEAQDRARVDYFYRQGVVAEVPPLETFKKAAVDLVEGQQTKDLDPHRYLVGQRKASREAFEALAKGDYAGAADAKQRELLNHFLFREAAKAKEEVASAYDFARRFGKASVREKLGKAGGELGQTVYLDQIDGILERFEFAQVSNKALAQRQSLVEFAMEAAAGGEVMQLDPILYSDRPRNYRELTLPELRAVRDALKNIETVARRQYEFIVNGQSVAFQDATAELVAGAYGNTKTKLLPLDPEARSRVDKAISTAKKVNSELVKMEELVDRLDGGDINGPWRRYVFEPMAEAQYLEHELNQKITLKLAEAMEAMPKEQRLSMGDKFELPELGGSVTRKFILSMAMNMGNESNSTKMLKGMGWASPDKVDAVGRALDKLNRADWEFVQKTWDGLGTLWPEIEALELRMRGIAPEQVQKKAFTVTLADGSTMQLDGGYYPVAYDPARSTAGAKQGDVEIMNSEGGWSGPATSQGHTKGRIEQAAHPMLLDFEQVLAKHASRVVKDLSHREAALAVAKLIRNQDVRTAVQETLGPEYEAQMLPWLKGTVNDVAAMNPELGRWMLAARSNMVVAGLAFRASSVIVQVTDMGRVMVGEHAVAPKYLAEGLALLSRDLAKATATWDGSQFETIQKIRSLSPEMATRAENLDRDTRAALKRLQGKEGVLASAQKAGMAGLAIADEITSYTTWWGAYKQGLAEGHSEHEAARMGDRVVRLKLQAGAPKDMTSLQRAGGLWPLATTYMGDAISTYGMLSRGAFETGQGRNVGRSAFAAVMAGMIIPLLGDLIKNRGPQDDENKAAWAAKQMAWAMPSSIPFARDVAQALQTGQDYKFTPLANAINKIVAKPVKMATGEKEHEWEDWFLTGLDSIGTGAGLPGTSQVMTSARYLRDVQQGKEEFNPIDAVLGPKPKKKGGR